MNDYKLVSRNLKILKRGYVGATVLLAVLIVATPFFAKGYSEFGIAVVLAEEIFECGLLAVLLSAGYAMTKLYRDQVEKSQARLREAETDMQTLELRLDDAFKYIGKVNVQVQEIESIFRSIKRYPQNKKDFQRLLSMVARKALSIVKADWVEFRFIDLITLRTLREHGEARTGSVVSRHSAANGAMARGEEVAGLSIIGSEWENLTVKAFCILPLESLTPRDQILIQVLVSEVEMLFVVFSSQYYKEKPPRA